MSGPDESERLANQIDLLADEFELAWQSWTSGPPPSISLFLDRVEDTLRPAVCEEITAIDREYRVKHGLSSSSLGWLKDDNMAGVPTAVQVASVGASVGDSTKVLGPHPIKPTPKQSRGPEIQIGDLILGKYKVIEELGAGGEATTYRALHASMGRDVVLKIAHDPCNPKLLHFEDLTKEARALAQLEHGDIARVHDVDVYEEFPFLVMELVRGRNLQQFKLGGPHPPRLYAKILARVARALDAAHATGIVHQDLTPRNILVTAENEPKLIDFGMAMIRRAGFENTSRIGGTPPYLSPEQALGDHDRIGPRTDVFGLGAVLYYLLVGRPLYSGGSLSQNLELAAKTSFDRDALNARGIPRPLAQICRKALQRDPADRFASAGEMARSLEAYMHRPRVMAAAACVGVLAAACVGLALWPFAEPFPRDFNPHLQLHVNPESRTDVDPVPIAMFERPVQTGDGILLRFDQPALFSATLFCVDSDGTISEWKTFDAPRENSRIAYPERKVRMLEGRPGTELLLLCFWSSRKPTIADIEAAWPDTGRWEAIPEFVTLHLNADGVEPEFHEHTRGEVELNSPIAGAEKRISDFRRALADRGIQAVFGIAFAHQGN